MSASWPGNMRGPRFKTPLLLLLLLLVTSPTTAQEDETSDPAPEEAEEQEETEAPVGDDPESVNGDVQTTQESDPSEPQESDPSEPGTQTDNGETGSGTPDVTPATDWTTLPPEDEQGLSLIIILIPVVLVVLIIGMIVCGIFINRRWNKGIRSHDLTKDDPYLDGSSTEKVPMPMFEEDVPSVLEMEMEEFDQLMKNGDTAEVSTHA